MKTTTLNNGLTVMAKETKYGLTAYTFANRTQAERAAEKVRTGGQPCRVWKGARPFYVVMETVAQV
jgi:hypothetical protein